MKSFTFHKHKPTAKASMGDGIPSWQPHLAFTALRFSHSISSEEFVTLRGSESSMSSHFWVWRLISSISDLFLPPGRVWWQVDWRQSPQKQFTQLSTLLSSRLCSSFRDCSTQMFYQRDLCWKPIGFSWSGKASMTTLVRDCSWISRSAYLLCWWDRLISSGSPYIWLALKLWGLSRWTSFRRIRRRK